MEKVRWSCFSDWKYTSDKGNWKFFVVDTLYISFVCWCCAVPLPTAVHAWLGCARKALFSKSKMNTPESCSFWVTDTGNISFSTQIHCFHQVLASWLSSISLLELKIFLLTNPPCHTSKVASWHVDCRYDLHFWCYLGKILSKSWKTCKKLWFKQSCQILPVFGLTNL